MELVESKDGASSNQPVGLNVVRTRASREQAAQISTTVRFSDPDARPQTATSKYDHGDTNNTSRVRRPAIGCELTGVAESHGLQRS